jgi:hypothetical protein
MEQSTNEQNLEEYLIEAAETRGEIISIANYALATCDYYDYSMLSLEDKERIDNIRRMSLILVEGFLSEIYFENYED